MKRKYVFNHISCANCAAKIEKKINQLNEVESATLNYLTKEITIITNQEIESDLLQEVIEQAINEVESGVTICEIKSNEITCQVTGLDCASCANKIETVLSQTEGILGAQVNLIANQITISFQEGYNQDELFENAQIIVDQIEPGAKLLRQTEEAPLEHHQKWDIIKILVALVLFGVGLWVGEDSVFYIPIFILAYVIVGLEIVYKAIKNLFQGNWFDENFLMSIATVGAFGIKEYPEAVAVMLFYQIGEWFQDLAVNRTRRSIKGLLSIKPEVANVKRDDQIIEMKVEQVKVDEIIVIKPGERIPLDSVVIKGQSSLDTKALTGESVPRDVEVGDSVLSGCINLDGYLTAKVVKPASESTINKVLELVQNAASKKAPTEKFITKFARYYTPVVTLLALALAILPPLLIEGATFTDWLYRAFIFLVISCPCALVISIPLGFFGGIGAASKQGVLIKGGNYLEALNRITVGIFDKTGTLTKGNFKVEQIKSFSSYNEIDLLEISAHVESFSNHPIAKSVVSAYNKPVNQELVSEISEISGHGMIGIYQNKKVLIGNQKLMKRESISFEDSNTTGSLLYIAIDGEYVGQIVVKDEIKPDSAKTIKWLKQMGIKTIMLTGDKQAVADEVGTQLGIDEVYAELLPEDKLTQVERVLNKQEGHVFFVGDGINDTPVLARADLGIAMGGMGSDAAIEVSDIVIMNDETSKLITAIKVAKKTRQIVWQNIIFALGVKLLFLTLGAFGEATMWEAVFADVGVSVLAILNAFRVLRGKNYLN